MILPLTSLRAAGAAYAAARRRARLAPYRGKIRLRLGAASPVTVSCKGHSYGVFLIGEGGAETPAPAA